MKIDFIQLEFIDQKLRNILAYVEDVADKEQTITSQLRIDDPGVHGQLPLRGTDLRCRDKNVGEALAQRINDRFTYDHARPFIKCAFVHGEDSNMHLHLQSHPNTVENKT